MSYTESSPKFQPLILSHLARSELSRAAAASG